MSENETVGMKTETILCTIGKGCRCYTAKLNQYLPNLQPECAKTDGGCPYQRTVELDVKVTIKKLDSTVCKVCGKPRHKNLEHASGCFKCDDPENHEHHSVWCANSKFCESKEVQHE